MQFFSITSAVILNDRHLDRRFKHRSICLVYCFLQNVAYIYCTNPVHNMKSLSRLIWLFAIIIMVNYSCKGNKPEDDSDSAASYTTVTHAPETFPDSDRDPNFVDSDMAKPAQSNDPNIKKVEQENANGIAHNVTQYKDGYYMATIDYFNPVSSYRSTYTLKIGVEHGMVVSIAFPHDEYMGDDKITPAELDVDGGCNVYGEHGKVYTVQIDHK